jgi:hypothetical protein
MILPSIRKVFVLSMNVTFDVPFKVLELVHIANCSATGVPVFVIMEYTEFPSFLNFSRESEESTYKNALPDAGVSEGAVISFI